MPPPTVSVLMPVYNADAYVSQAIKSILSQTFEDFEFIIINDGSTDKSLQILKKHANQDHRIKLISRENRGLVKTLNEMVEIAKAPFLARMDADDISLPERFQDQLEYLNNNNQCVAVGCQAILIDPQGLPLCPFLNITEHDDIDSAHMKGKGGAICHPSVIIRKKSINQIGGYSSKCENAEDIDLFLKLAEIGQLHNLDKILFMYRMHLSSIGHKNRISQNLSTHQAVYDAHSRRKLTEKPEIDQAISQAPISPSLTHKKWAWWAISAGNDKTAIKHAILALFHAPLSLTSWKVLICATRGYLTSFSR